MHSILLVKTLNPTPLFCPPNDWSLHCSQDGCCLFHTPSRTGGTDECMRGFGLVDEMRHAHWLLRSVRFVPHAQVKSGVRTSGHPGTETYGIDLPVRSCYGYRATALATSTVVATLICPDGLPAVCYGNRMAQLSECNVGLQRIQRF